MRYSHLEMPIWVDVNDNSVRELKRGAVVDFVRGGNDAPYAVVVDEKGKFELVSLKAITVCAAKDGLIKQSATGRG